MGASALLRRPPRVRGDLLPASAGAFLVSVSALSLAFRAAAYLLAPDPAAITQSRDWIFHAFWLPFHLLLARYAAVVFAQNVDACLAFAASDQRPALERTAASVTAPSGWLMGLALVAPFMLLDAGAGAGYIREAAPAQGRAAVLVPAIWMIEWLATAQIWLFVLGSVRFNARVLSAGNLAARHERVLLAGDGKAPLLCGVQNGFIIGMYGLSTVAYVWFADGQVSDYLVLAISMAFVLVCFFAALLQMKNGLRQSLDAEFHAFCAVLEQERGEGKEGARLPYGDFKEALALVYEKRGSPRAKDDERLRRIRLATVLASPPSGCGLEAGTYRRALLLYECEVRFAQFGTGEIKALSLRAFMPLLVVGGKSAAAVMGV